MMITRRNSASDQGIREIRVGEIYTNIVLSEKQGEETVPRIRKKTIPTKQLNNIIKYQFLTNNRQIILPDNCKFLKQYPNGEKLLIIEEKPQVRTVSVDLSMEATIARLEKTGKLKEYGYENFLNENKRPYKFRLSFPYIVYFVALSRDNCIDEMDIFYRLSPITSYNDYLLETNLLNVDDSNDLCFGDLDVDNQTVKNVVDGAISAFWTNSFNKDYIGKYEKYQNVHGVGDFLTWSYNTLNDPMFVFSVEWIPDSKNIQDEIKRIEFNLEFDSGNFNCFEILNKPDLSDKMDNPPEEIYLENSTAEAILLRNRIINVGDSFPYKNGKEVYINSFLGNEDFVQVENWNGKLINLKLTIGMRCFIEKQLYKKDELTSAMLPNGEEVDGDYKLQAGDVLEFLKPAGSKG